LHIVYIIKKGFRLLFFEKSLLKSELLSEVLDKLIEAQVLAKHAISANASKMT